MSSIKTTDDEMIALEISYGELTRRFAEEGINPFACAAVMVKLALMIYKTSLNDEEYNLMVDSISDSRNHIRSMAEYANNASSRMN